MCQWHMSKKYSTEKYFVETWYTKKYPVNKYHAQKYSMAKYSAKKFILFIEFCKINFVLFCVFIGQVQFFLSVYWKITILLTQQKL